MKTVVAFEHGEQGLMFYVVDEDLTRFEGVFINMICKTKQEGLLHQELYHVCYDSNGDWLLGDAVTIRQARDAIVAGAQLVYCGFLP